MIITVEIMVNPGPKALFVAEVKLEKSATLRSNVSNWWGFWLSWWLYRGRWKHYWLYGWENSDSGGWRTRQARLLGFEINWQCRRYVG